MYFLLYKCGKNLLFKDEGNNILQTLATFETPAESMGSQISQEYHFFWAMPFWNRSNKIEIKYQMRCVYEYWPGISHSLSNDLKWSAYCKGFLTGSGGSRYIRRVWRWTTGTTSVSLSIRHWGGPTTRVCKVACNGCLATGRSLLVVEKGIILLPKGALGGSGLGATGTNIMLLFIRPSIRKQCMHSILYAWRLFLSFNWQYNFSFLFYFKQNAS